MFVRSLMIATTLVLGVAGTSAQQTYYVSVADGDDAWSGLCAAWDGVACGPKRTIKGAVDLAVTGDTIIVADGLYTDWDNFGIVLAGRDLVIQASSPSATLT